MQLQAGTVHYIDTSLENTRSRLYTLSATVQKHCTKILIIDTMQVINPHRFAYNHVRQQNIFNNIFYRAPKNTSEFIKEMDFLDEHIRLRKIESILIPSLNIVQNAALAEEAIKYITEKLSTATKEHNLITIAGISPAINNYNLLKNKDKSALTI